MEKKKEQIKESNETVDEEQDKLSLFLQLEQMMKDEEMDVEDMLKEKQAVEEEVKKLRRKVSFNFNNLSFTIKERELYRRRMYFRYFKRLSVLRPALCPLMRRASWTPSRIGR